MEQLLPPGVAAMAETRDGAFIRLMRWMARAGDNYRLARFVILRFMGLVYFTAFLVAAQQMIPLIGHDGLLPADTYMEAVEKHFGSREAAFRELPSIFWWNHSDEFIQRALWLGVALSFVVMCGYANVPILLALWALYLSLAHIGQQWTSYGWDTQILETGFLAMMLAPLFDGRPFARATPPVVIIWLFRWLMFRIMLGAGLIKMRGDEVWRDLTALVYHYETQPVPGPLSRLFHFMPLWFHKGGVLMNHFVELVVPWFGFGPRIARHIAGVLMVGFMVILILSGNLSFLNWLTIIPCLACFDDTFWRRVLPRFLTRRADAPVNESARLPVTRSFVSVGFAAIIAWFSIKGPIPNLISSQQAMNTSFDTLHLCGSYGAFGSITRERFEIVFQGTTDLLPDSLADWRDYEFKVKPGDPMRRPPWITPYHYRLDWQAWHPWHTAGPQPWTIHFVWKLLHNDPGTLSLLANNPFPGEPPRHIRAIIYKYTFAQSDDPEGAWWKRERISGYLIPPLNKEHRDLLRAMRQMGWLRED